MSEAKKISRRKFLAVSATAVGAGVLVCGGGAALALQPSNTEWINTTLGENGKMNQRILVAYVSQCGSTGETARFVGDVLAKSGAVVDVAPAHTVRRLDGYHAVVLGSAARYGKLLPGAQKFVQKFNAELKDMPAAYFFAGVTLREDTPENRVKASAYLEPLRALKQPVSEGLFGGKVDYQKLEPLWRFLLSLDRSKAGEMSEGDFRNWDKIQAWAEGLVPVLVG